MHPFPNGARHFVPIIRPTRSDRPIVACTLGSPWACPCHWVPDDERSRPCVAFGGRCRWCEEGLDVRCRAWVPVCGSMNPERALLELTWNATSHLSEIASQAGGYRGHLIEVRRVGLRRRAPVVVHRVGPAPVKPLPEPVDVRKTMSRVWGMSPDAAGSVIWEEVPHVAAS